MTLTTKEFIEKVVEVHGNLYDYSKSKYTKSCIKIEIICKKHGSFWQKPKEHMAGYGCSICGGSKLLTIQEFIKKARHVHDNKYDYSKSNYINSKSKIEIVCKEHGSFYQTPSNHLRGQECIKCVTNKQVFSTKEFIESSIKIHGTEYDYSKVNYIKSNQKVEIVCKKHGSFFQKPNNHLTGFKCLTCSMLKNRLTTQEFIQKAKNIHGNLYDYSKVKYISTKIKVEIICFKHGSFLQIPNSHLTGRGCSNCSHLVSKPETQWLDQFKNSNIIRQHKITLNNKRFNVDGFDPKTNTIYEFLGDYYHGNPKKYKKNVINQRSKKTFGDLYQETMNRIKLFKKNGYNVNYVWENDFDKWLKLR